MKLGVCVPYRNREEHMNKFVPHIHKFLNDRGIEHAIYLGHQCDDKLFNRGLMKNVAAKAAFDDGCDYIVWHDIDMVPEDDSCDYSYNPDSPKHLAVRISQSDYNLKYEEYFGGAVLFTKEQVYKTNGYSNDYWDWGMEDDDLFWRCQLEGYTDKKYIEEPKKEIVAHYNGLNSVTQIIPSSPLRGCLHENHTVSILVKAEQQINKAPIYLIGDTERIFVEYPIFRKPGFDWGISFNNSRAYTAMLWDSKKNHIYQWMKRYESEWTWVTMVVDAKNKKMHLYLNGEESDARNGTGTPSPIQYENELKRYGAESFFVGHTQSWENGNPNKWFKGYISKIKMWNKCLTQEEIKKSFVVDEQSKNFILNVSFNKNIKDGSFLMHKIFSQNVEFTEEEIKIPKTALPYRRDGKFLCLPHQTEGLINVGGIEKWAKGETTAANERRYILKMQQGEIDYKSDGMNNMEEKYEFLSKESILGISNAYLINVKCK